MSRTLFVEGVGIMSYNFILGEEKEVGIEINAIDITNFSITSSTFQLFSHMGIEMLAVSNANINGHKTFKLIKPSSGIYQKGIFKCVLTPLDALGNIDYTKNVETIIAEVQVNCK